MNDLRYEIREYLRENMGIYILIIAFFIGGILTGALAVRSLGDNQAVELHHYFSAFVEQFLGQGEWDQGAILRRSLKLNFQHLAAIWVLGMLVFGFPFTLLLLMLRGFSMGFTVGFLVGRAAWRGVFFALGAVLPHNLIIVPALLVATATGFSFSWLRLRGCLDKQPYPLRRHLGPYTMMIVLMSMAVFIGCLVEAYISPVFTRVLLPVMG